MPSANARKLKKLITTRDPAAILQGVELAVALGDGAIVDELLDGVYYDREATIPLPPWMRGYGGEHVPRGRIVLPKSFAPSERQRLFSELGLLGLISHGPGERAAALRETITVLAIEHEDEHVPALFDAWLVSGLASLTSLRVRPRRVVRLGSLGALPSLVELRVGAHRRTELAGDLAGLGRAPRLRTLSLDGRGLESLAGLEGARLERLDLAVESLRDLGALAECEVHRLDLRCGRPESFAPIARMKALNELVVYEHVALDLAMLAGARCRRLELRSYVAPALALSDLPALEELDVHSFAAPAWKGSPARAQLELMNVPALRRLRVGGDPHLRVARLDAPALEQLVLRASVLELGEVLTPSLREASLRGVTDDVSFDALVSLRGLDVGGPLRSLERMRDLPALTSLRLECPALTSLRGMPEVRPDEGVSEELSLSRHTKLRDLEGIGRYRGLARLTLNAASSLQSLRGIDALTSLRELDLSYCGRLTSLEGLEQVRSLRVLDLRGCKALRDVSALAALDDLRVIAIHGAALARHNFPDSVAWAVTDAFSPDLERLARRRPPKNRVSRRKGPVAPEHLRVWDEVVPSLREPDSPAVDAAIARLRASGAAAPILDALLAGTRVGRSWLEPGRAMTKLFGKHSGDAAITAVRLLGEIDASTPALDALRAGIVCLDASQLPYVPALARFDLRWLRALGSLTRLAWRRSVIGPDGLLHARRLRELLLGDLGDATDLACMAEARELRRLRLLRAPPSLRGIGALERVEEVTLHAPKEAAVRDLGDLASCASLRHLRIDVAPGCDLAPLAELASLEELTLTAAGPVDLGPLAACSRLRKLDLDSACEALPELPRSLRVLRARGEQLGSIAAIEPLDALELLVIRDAPRLEGLPRLPRSLVALDLHGAGSPELSTIASSWLRSVVVEATPVRDLAHLAGAMLEELLLEGCSVVDVSPLLAAPRLARLALHQPAPAVDLTPLVDHPALMELDASLSSMLLLPAAARARLSAHVGRPIFRDFEGRW